MSMRLGSQKKVMSVLLQIDSTADLNSTLSFGNEPSPGQKPEVMEPLGTEVVFNLQNIKKHYDALGSYLHVPSLKQTLSGPDPDYRKIRKRCEEISGVLERVLASLVFNSTFGIFSSFDCFECKVRIRRRMPSDRDTLEIDCFDCLASYTLTRTKDGQTRADLHQQKEPCANTGCSHPIIILRREIAEGHEWTCEKCGGRNVFQLGLVHHP